MPLIRRKLDDLGIGVPLVGDFHYNGHQLLREHPAAAAALAKYRINPGNVGGKRRDEHFATIIRVAIEHDKPVRIGVNWGSLDQDLLTELMEANARSAAPVEARDVLIEAMIASALRSAELAEATGLAHDRIIVSAKVSAVRDLVDTYRELARRCDYPLHVGLTEAGMGMKGTVASAAGLAILLDEGIGDTIRVSLTPAPGGDRTEEVQVAMQVLQSLGLRSFRPQVSACPGCGRTTSTFFQEMAQRIERHIGERMPAWSARYPGVEDMHVAVMGCVVNGPGRIQAGGHRHQPAGHLRGARGARLRGRRAAHHAARRGPRGGVHRAAGGLRGAPLRRSGRVGHRVNARHCGAPWIASCRADGAPPTGAGPTGRLPRGRRAQRVGRHGLAVRGEDPRLTTGIPAKWDIVTTRERGSRTPSRGTGTIVTLSRPVGGACMAGPGRPLGCSAQRSPAARQPPTGRDRSSGGNPTSPS